MFSSGRTSESASLDHCSILYECTYSYYCTYREAQLHLSVLGTRKRYRSSSADMVCTSIEDTGDHWNRTHLIFLESNGHGSLINSFSRKQCSSTRNREIDHQVQI